MAASERLRIARATRTSSSVKPSAGRPLVIDRDLAREPVHRNHGRLAALAQFDPSAGRAAVGEEANGADVGCSHETPIGLQRELDVLWQPAAAATFDTPASRRDVQREQDRSEEHTSELQSLMRTSYAV